MTINTHTPGKSLTRESNSFYSRVQNIYSQIFPTRGRDRCDTLVNYNNGRRKRKKRTVSKHWWALSDNHRIVSLPASMHNMPRPPQPRTPPRFCHSRVGMHRTAVHSPLLLCGCQLLCSSRSKLFMPFCFECIASFHFSPLYTLSAGTHSAGRLFTLTF